MADRSDNFDRANSTSLGTPSDGGSAWAGSSSTYGTTSNQAYLSGSAGWNTAVWLEASSATGHAQITYISGTSVNSGILARIVDAQNFILGQFTGTAFFIFKRVAGTFTQIGPSFSGTLTANDVIRITASGNSLSLQVNGITRISGTDAAHNTATKWGFVENNGNSIRYEDFSFTDAGGSPFVRPKLTIRSQAAHRASRR